MDTGASKTLVRGDFVTEDDILDGEVTTKCAHGDTLSYPLAAVRITIKGKEIITEAAVSDILPAAALLGTFLSWWNLSATATVSRSRGSNSH